MSDNPSAFSPDEPEEDVGTLPDEEGVPVEEIETSDHDVVPDSVSELWDRNPDLEDDTMYPRWWETSEFRGGDEDAYVVVERVEDEFRAGLYGPGSIPQRGEPDKVIVDWNTDYPNTVMKVARWFDSREGSGILRV